MKYTICKYKKLVTRVKYSKLDKRRDWGKDYILYMEKWRKGKER